MRNKKAQRNGRSLRIQTSSPCRSGVRAHRSKPVSWLKIRNPNYSQWEGREELFERDIRPDALPGLDRLRRGL